MFHYEILWFYQDFKSENLCFLNLYPVHAVRILGLLLEIMLSILKRGTKHLWNCNTYFSMSEQVSYFYFSEAKFVNVF